MAAIPAAKQSDGSLELQTTRAKASVRVKRIRLGSLLQLTDWDDLDDVTTYKFGWIRPDENADSPDGLKFSATRDLDEDEREALGLELANRTRISNPGERFQRGVITNIEAVSQYQPAIARGVRGDIGLFQRLGNDTVWAEGKDNVTEGLLSGYWILENHPSMRGDSKAEEIRAGLERDLEPLLNEQTLREFTESAFDTGPGIWEIVDRSDGGVAELAFCRADTIETWITDTQESELLRIGFNTGSRKYELDARNCLVYSHRRTGANFEGRPQMRSAATLIEMKHQMLRLTAYAGEVHGLGIKTIESTDPEQAGNTAVSAKLVDIFDTLTAEDNPVIELPTGQTFKWHSPGNGMPPFLPIIEFLNQEIARPASSTGTLLGFQHYGSKSLGEVADTKSLRTVVHYGTLLANAFRRSIIPRILRNKYGAPADFPAPILRYATQREVKDPERHKRLVTYKTAGLLTWTREDEQRLRSEEGMAPLPKEAPETSEDAGSAKIVEPADPATALLRETAASAFNQAQQAGG